MTQAKPRGQSVDEKDLLWVAETPCNLSNKAAAHSKIRSHARKYAVKSKQLLNAAARYPALAPRAHGCITKQEQDQDCLSFIPRLAASQETNRLSKPPEPIKLEGRSRNEDRNASSDDSIEKHRRLAGIVKVLGAGRVDPFSCLPVDKPKPYIYELIDHTITTLIPGLVPDDAEQLKVNAMSKAWFASALKIPFVFHALVFTGSVHKDFLHFSKIFPNAPRALKHKIFVIKKLNEIIADPKQNCGDEVILVILVLGCHEIIDPSQDRKHPFKPPLDFIGWINVYGNMKYVPEHLNAMRHCIDRRGGLDNLQLLGLAEAISTGDVMAATNLSSKPFYPALKVWEAPVAVIKDWAASPPQLTQPQASHFRKLKHLGVTEEMIEVFNAIGAVTLAIHQYLGGKLVGLKIGTIARARTASQHGLLSLPSANELKESCVDKRGLYECCRLAALIYGVGVGIPVPNHYPIFQDLVIRLKSSLEALSTENQDVDLLLWMLVLGGIAAFDKRERTWFVSELAKLCKARDLSNWKKVKDILFGFLWLESACSEGGKLLWSEVLHILE